MMSRWSVHRFPFLNPAVLTHPQAFKLYPASSCYSSPDHQRVNRLYHIMGSLPVRRIIRSTSPAPCLDLDHNCTCPFPTTRPNTSANQKPTPPDLDLPLPRHAKPRHDQTRNGSRLARRLGRQLRQHVVAPAAVASDAGERARGPCFRHHAQTVGLGGCDLPAHEGCGECGGVVSACSFSD